jgi:NAD-dependent SIR2 family protein deacetylase
VRENMKLSLYHYTCKNIDQNIDGFPEMAVLKDSLQPEPDKFIHLQCTACEEKVALRLDSED